MEKEKNHVVYASEATHTALAIWAATKKISIKLVLEQLVDAEKARNELSPKPEFKK